MTPKAIDNKIKNMENIIEKRVKSLSKQRKYRLKSTGSIYFDGKTTRLAACAIMDLLDLYARLKVVKEAAEDMDVKVQYTPDNELSPQDVLDDITGTIANIRLTIKRNDLSEMKRQVNRLKSEESKRADAVVELFNKLDNA